MFSSVFSDSLTTVDMTVLASPICIKPSTKGTSSMKALPAKLHIDEVLMWAGCLV